ncbi:MAG TPA: DUF4365 domain-containing protein [Flavobacteriales bacterium]|nr:DUF4365 domain-containing protein [Flavobacteriales bacterium]
MDLNKQKELFSLGVMKAMLAQCGLKMGEWDVDDDSIDFTIGQTGGKGTIRSPKLDVQMKCTSQSVLEASGLKMQLKRKNYEDLRDMTRGTPAILVVMVVPDDVKDWITVEKEKLYSLYRHAWWYSLGGQPALTIKTDPTILIPRAQHLTPAVITSLMQKVANKQWP